MRRLVIVAAVAGLLAGCASGYPGYPGHARQARVSETDHVPYRIERRGNETDYVMLDRVLFPTDSAEIGPHAFDIVADVAADARAHPLTSVEVDGFTDTTGTPDYNQHLSDARAGAVAELLRRHGISAQRVSTRGFGETHLAVPTGNNVREAQNRRVVIRIISG